MEKKENHVQRRIMKEISIGNFPNRIFKNGNNLNFFSEPMFLYT